MMLMMVFWMIVPLLLIVAAADALGSRLHSDPAASAQPGAAPMDILKERYARGEISREEYEHLRRDLES